MYDNHYDWQTFYKAFSNKLLEYRNNRAELIIKIKDIYTKIGINLPNLSKNNDFKDIDPFTVFGLFNKGITESNRLKIIVAIIESFDIETFVPTDFSGIPILNNINSLFFKYDDSEVDIENLWGLFVSAKAYAKDASASNRLDFIKYFDLAINIIGNANSKITMGLFWIEPDIFLNLDQRSTWYIYESEQLPESFVKGLPKIAGKIAAIDYLVLIEKIHDYFASEQSLFTNFIEMSYEAWDHSEEINAKNAAPSNSNFIRWMAPILQALKDLGGSGKTDAVRDQIILNENLDEATSMVITGKDNFNRFIDEVGLALTYLVYDGFIDNSIQGVWTLTNTGEMVQMSDKLASEILKRGQKKILKSSHHEVNKPYTKEDFLSEVYIEEDEYTTISELLEIKKNLILQGAPGVGKTYAAKRLAYSLMGLKDNERVTMVQFHQSYSYEDLIEGYRPAGNTFEIKKGSLYNFCTKASDDRDNKYYFIIDEINRGNLSKIFGELFMLIESDQRDKSLQLLYSDEQFSVPPNVYLIGLMNTADRSLAMLDYALRRRFAFYEMIPGFNSKGFLNYQNVLGNTRFNAVIEVVKRLNKAIVEDDSLGEGFCIGHSYFITNKMDDKYLANVIQYEIIPLLKEYWFDEPDKVREWTTIILEALR